MTIHLDIEYITHLGETYNGFTARARVDGAEFEIEHMELFRDTILAKVDEQEPAVALWRRPVSAVTERDFETGAEWVSLTGRVSWSVRKRKEGHTTEWQRLKGDEDWPTVAIGYEARQ